MECRLYSHSLAFGSYVTLLTRGTIEARITLFTPNSRRTRKTGTSCLSFVPLKSREARLTFNPGDSWWSEVSSVALLSHHSGVTDATFVAFDPLRSRGAVFSGLTL